MKKIFLLYALFFAVPALAQQPIDNRGPWTELEVKKLCHHRADGSAARYQSCMISESRRIGRAKQPGQASELSAADRVLSKKAAERMASQPETTGATP